MSLLNVTITGNHADVSTGGLYNLSTVALRNSIVAGNTAVSNNNDWQDVLSGVTTDLGNNIRSGDPMLGPLQHNGGPTLTRMPLPGSPAIDAGDNAAAAAAGLTNDQRGAGLPAGAETEPTRMSRGRSTSAPSRRIRRSRTSADKTTLEDVFLQFPVHVGDATPSTPSR